MTPPTKMLIVCAVLVAGASACGNTFTAGAAVVNGESISQDALDERIRAAGSAGPEGGADPAVQRQALQQLIEEALVRQEAQRREVSVTDAEVDQQFEQIRAQFPSPEQFQEALQARGFTEESLKAAIRDQLQRERLGRQLGGEISDADVREVYRTEQERFTEVRARHILLRVEDQAQDQQVRARAQGLAQRIRQGASFGTLARQNSDDQASAQNGGDLGFFPLADLVPEFAQAAANAEIGEIVGPVRTQFGYHVIEVLERRTQPFEEVGAELRQQLEQQASERAINDYLQDALQRARVAVNPRYGDWDPETASIVPHESFVPASPAPDPNARPEGMELFPPQG